MYDFNKLGSHFRTFELANSQTLKLINAVQKYNTMLSNIGEPMLQTIEALEDKNKSISALLDSPVMNMINNINKYDDILFGSITSKAFTNVLQCDNKLFDLLSSSSLKIVLDHQENFKNICYLSRFPAINAIVGEINNNYLLKASDISNSFLGKMLSHINEFNFPHTHQLPFENIVAIENYFDNKCKELPHSIITYEGMIHLLFTIIIFIISIHMNNLSEEKLSKAILLSQQNILQHIEKLKPQFEEKESFFIVMREITLKTKPTNKSDSLGLIHPNQKVILLQNKGKWIYINYFDYINGVPKTGWALKKYLKRVVN